MGMFRFAVRYHGVLIRNHMSTQIRHAASARFPQRGCCNKSGSAALDAGSGSEGILSSGHAPPHGRVEYALASVVIGDRHCERFCLCCPSCRCGGDGRSASRRSFFLRRCGVVLLIIVIFAIRIAVVVFVDVMLSASRFAWDKSGAVVHYFAATRPSRGLAESRTAIGNERLECLSCLVGASGTHGPAKAHRPFRFPLQRPRLSLE